MLATSLRRTALSAATKSSSCINTTTAAAAAAAITSRCFASAPVDFDHFSSGWEKDSSEYKTEGKFHIETFNKISPLVSFAFFSSSSSSLIPVYIDDVMTLYYVINKLYHIYSMKKKFKLMRHYIRAYSIVGFNNL